MPSYRPSHPGTHCAFMEEFGQFLEILSVCWEKLVICGDFNYGLDNPSLKPYTNEFMSLLDINNMPNYVPYKCPHTSLVTFST